MDEVSEIISTKENENDIIRDFRPPPDVTDLATVLKTEENSNKKLLYNLQKPTQQRLLVFLFYVFHSTPTDKKVFLGKLKNLVI